MATVEKPTPVAETPLVEAPTYAKATFAKLADDAWGVRIDGHPKPVVASGDEITVTRRNGDQTVVELDEVLETFNQGRSVYASIAAKKRSGNGRKGGPRPSVLITSRVLAKNGDELDSWESRGKTLSAWLDASAWEASVKKPKGSRVVHEIAALDV